MRTFSHIQRIADIVAAIDSICSALGAYGHNEAAIGKGCSLADPIWNKIGPVGIEPLADLIVEVITFARNCDIGDVFNFFGKIDTLRACLESL